jgi:hypothetical protein
MAFQSSAVCDSFVSSVFEEMPLPCAGWNFHFALHQFLESNFHAKEQFQYEEHISWLTVVCCSRGDSLSTQMAFAPGKTEYPCQLCNEKYPWFRLFVSENPATHGYRDMGPQTPSACAEALELGQSTVSRTQPCKSKVCIKCEVRWRVDSQDLHNRAVGRIDPNLSSEDTVTAEMKRQNNSKFLQKQAAHYNAVIGRVPTSPRAVMVARGRAQEPPVCATAHCPSRDSGLCW